MDNLRIKYSKFNKCFFALLLIFLFLISAFNYFVDSFYIYKSELIQGFNLIKPRIKQQERLTKNLEFKLDKNKYDAIFLGSSKVDFSLHPQYYEQITGKKAKNLALVGSSPDEMIEFAKDSTLLIHESTYVNEDADKAKDNFHSTSSDAARIAKKSNSKQLVLTHLLISIPITKVNVIR